MHWYIGQSVQDERGGWVPPAWADAQWDVAGATLLRSKNVSPDPSAVYLGQGDLRELKPAKSLLTTLGEMFRAEARGTTLADVLLTRWSEAGTCLMPHLGKVAMHFGAAEPVAVATFDQESPAGLKVLARVRSDYERLRDEWKAEALTLELAADKIPDKQVADKVRERAAKTLIQHEKVLGAMLLEYRGVSIEKLLPEKYRDDSPRQPETSYAEDFDGADKAGVGYDQTWTEYEGTGWNNASNQALLSGVSSGDHSARLESDLSSANHYAQAALAVHSHSGGSTTVGSGPAVRFATSAQTFYYAYHFQALSGSFHARYRQVTGTHTQIGSNNAASYSSLPKTAKIEINGSTLTTYYDGSLIATDTDSNVTGNLRCGLYGFSSSVLNSQAWDDFLCADLFSGSPWYYYANAG